MVYLDVFHEQEIVETKQRLATLTYGTPNFGNSKYVPELPDWKKIPKPQCRTL